MVTSEFFITVIIMKWKQVIVTFWTVSHIIKKAKYFGINKINLLIAQIFVQHVVTPIRVDLLL